MNFLTQALIYLAAAVICVPIAKRLGMGSVLGYLLAGMLIGPFVLGFIGKEGQDIMHFAEFGVVMMLFLIGLELEPSHILENEKIDCRNGINSADFNFITYLSLMMILGLCMAGIHCSRTCFCNVIYSNCTTDH